MIVPNEFRRLVGAFYQGSDREFTTQEEWVQSRIAYLKKAEQGEVRRFLDDLLGGATPDSALQEVWKTGNSCYDFRDKDLRAFLTFLRSQIAE